MILAYIVSKSPIVIGVPYNVFNPESAPLNLVIADIVLFIFCLILKSALAS
jgi:hypothetical protein